MICYTQHRNIQFKTCLTTNRMAKQSLINVFGKRQEEDVHQTFNLMQCTSTQPSYAPHLFWFCNVCVISKSSQPCRTRSVRRNIKTDWSQSCFIKSPLKACSDLLTLIQHFITSAGRPVSALRLSFLLSTGLQQTSDWLSTRVRSVDMKQTLLHPITIKTKYRKTQLNNPLNSLVNSDSSGCNDFQSQTMHLDNQQQPSVQWVSCFPSIYVPQCDSINLPCAYFILFCFCSHFANTMLFPMSEEVRGKVFKLFPGFSSIPFSICINIFFFILIIDQLQHIRWDSLILNGKNRLD